MQPVTNAILNMLFVGIPEEAFIAIITLTFLKELDNLFDIYMWKKNLKWILIATLPTSILVSVLRFVIAIPQIDVILLAMVLMITSMIYIVIKNSDNITIPLIFKTAIFTLAGFVITGIVEYAYCPIISSLLHKPLEFFNNVFLYNFLLGLPARVLYTCVVTFITMKKNGKIQVNLFNIIIKSKFFTSSFMIILLSIVLIIAYIAKLVDGVNILINLQFIDQFIIIILITSVPTILITWALMFVNYLLSKRKQIYQSCENMINTANNNNNQDDYYYEYE